jgi:regulatory protein
MESLPGVNITTTEKEQLSIVREKALELLSYRDHSEKELLDKLLARKCSKDLSLQVVEELRESGYLDEKRFAVALVTQRVRSRPAGVRSLVSLLCSKGLGHNEALEIVQTVMEREGVDERQLALEIVKKELRGREIDDRMRKRLWGKLIRRGFDTAIAGELLSRLTDTGSTAMLEVDSEKL